MGNRSILIFVTVCANHRKSILARPEIHDLLVDLWGDTTQWVVGCYIIMPDHLHLFCAPASRNSVNVRNWIGYWKSRSAIRWPDSSARPVWQRHAWDRQLRNGESYTEKWHYVRNNPVRAGLVQRVEEWPYQGEMNALSWHDA